MSGFRFSSRASDAARIKGVIVMSHSLTTPLGTSESHALFSRLPVDRSLPVCKHAAFS